MNCPNCNAEVSESETFCHKCGKNLSEPDSSKINTVQDKAPTNKRSIVAPLLAAAVVLLILSVFSGYFCFVEHSKSFSAEKRLEDLSNRKAEVDAFDAAKWDRYFEITQLLRSINNAVSSTNLEEVSDAEAVLKELLPKEAALKKDLQHIGELTEKDYSYIYNNSTADTRETDVTEWITAKQEYLKNHPLPTDEEIDRLARNENGALHTGTAAIELADRDIENELFDIPYKIDVENEYPGFPETNFNNDLKDLMTFAEKDLESHRSPFIISMVLSILLAAGFAVCLIAALVNRTPIRRQITKKTTESSKTL